MAVPGVEYLKGIITGAVVISVVVILFKDVILVQAQEANITLFSPMLVGTIGGAGLLFLLMSIFF
ncbi:MAG: hypothetical protein ACTSYM_00465 [Candidatus Baldrarchaeia archaeon]